jgi:hypothetical protein
MNDKQKIIALEEEIKTLKEKIVKDSWQPCVETITDDWGYTRTIIHEMGQ